MPSMNKVVIIFVPVDVSQSEVNRALKKALEEEFESEALGDAELNRNGSDQSKALPFWTWFLPNPSL
jgi:hypothetical protein